VYIILFVLIESSTPVAAGSAEVRMTMKSFDPKNSYIPSILIVAKGTKVTFRNLDVIPHTATSLPSNGNAGFDTGMIMPSQVVSKVFNVPGTFKYFCIYHPMMHGLIIVM